MISFLMLNRNSADLAKQCIDSIVGLQDIENAVLLIVDNATTDGTLDELKEYAADAQNKCKTFNLKIEFIEINENLGFSKANNLGYKYLRENYDNIEYMFVINSDIEFSDPYIIKGVREDNKLYSFDILGPDIYCPNESKWWWKGHQSPKFPFEGKRKYCEKQVAFDELRLKKIKGEVRSVEWVIKYNLFRIYFKTIQEIAKWKYSTVYRSRRHTHVELQGACFILPSRFIYSERELFTPITMIYYEEPLLHLRMEAANKLMVYDPNIKVTHHQGGSTTRFKTKDMDLFVRNCFYESGTIYLNELKKYGK